MGFLRLAVYVALGALALPPGAAAGKLYLSVAGKPLEWSDDCEIGFFFYNHLAQTVDAITIDITIHNSEGRKIATRTLRYRYVDPSDGEIAQVRVKQPCDWAQTARVRAVRHCRIGGKLYRDCETELPAEIDLKDY